MRMVSIKVKESKFYFYVLTECKQTKIKVKCSAKEMNITPKWNNRKPTAVTRLFAVTTTRWRNNVYEHEKSEFRCVPVWMNIFFIFYYFDVSVSMHTSAELACLWCNLFRMHFCFPFVELHPIPTSMYGISHETKKKKKNAEIFQTRNRIDTESDFYEHIIK